MSLLLVLAIIFAGVAVISALFGFRGAASAAASMARLFAFVFVVLFFIFLVLSLL